MPAPPGAGCLQWHSPSNTTRDRAGQPAQVGARQSWDATVGGTWCFTSPSQLWCKLWGFPLTVPHSPPLRPNSCPLQHGRDKGVPWALLACVPHHPGHHQGMDPPAQPHRETGCWDAPTWVSGHTGTQEGWVPGCAGTHAPAGHPPTHPQTHRDAHAGGGPVPGPVAQPPHAPEMPKSSAQPCAPPNQLPGPCQGQRP